MIKLCTIATEGEWTTEHLPRWVRYAKRSGAELYLFLVSDDPQLQDEPVFSEFKMVRRYPEAVAERRWFNRIRMSATTEFGVDEILYCDCDADILEPLDDVMKVSDKPLMWVKSPKKHGQWVEICRIKGIDSWEANNGFLYLRKDFGKEYEDAEKEILEMKPDPRVAGTFAFNWMLRKNPDVWAEIPYIYSTIWSDVENLRHARCIQYCNEVGQEKRLMLEGIYQRSL